VSKTKPGNKQISCNQSRRSLSKAISGFGVLALFAGLSARAVSFANSVRPAGLPKELDEFLTQTTWKKRGTATLRVLLFRVYDATLWASTEKSNPLEEGAPFALDITYAMAVKRDDIVNSSMQEITRMRNPNSATLNRWTAALNVAIPSVVGGDRLLGVSVPGKGARFYHNGTLTGEISDVAFSEAFFAIWLDGNTKKPDVRRALLSS
jgi:hypothetical protein